jgi:hypothetical protein
VFIWESIKELAWTGGIRHIRTGLFHLCDLKMPSRATPLSQPLAAPARCRNLAINGIRTLESQTTRRTISRCSAGAGGELLIEQPNRTHQPAFRYGFGCGLPWPTKCRTPLGPDCPGRGTGSPAPQLHRPVSPPFPGPLPKFTSENLPNTAGAFNRVLLADLMRG